MFMSIFLGTGTAVISVWGLMGFFSRSNTMSVPASTVKCLFVAFTVSQILIVLIQLASTITLNLRIGRYYDLIDYWLVPLVLS